MGCGACGCHNEDSVQPLFQEVDVEQAYHWWLEGQVLFIDVREKEERDLESIPKTVFYPLSTFDPFKVVFKENQAIVFYCRSGRRSQVAAHHFLEVHSHHKSYVYNLTGGILSWKASNHPLESAHL